MVAGLPPDATGQPVRPIVDSGSPGAAVRSRASDTVGTCPEMSSYLATFAYSPTHPDASPPDANGWNCTPSAAHPHPIVLVHGTWLNA